MIHKLVTGGTIGAVTFGAALADQRLNVPLFTACSVMITAMTFIFTVGSKVQKTLDKVEDLDRRMTVLEDSIKAGAEDRAQHFSEVRERIRRNSLTAGGLRLLIIDDNRNDVYLLSRMLRPDYLVDECSTLEEARTRLAANDYDCVILDLNLPGTSARRTVAEFRAMSPHMLCIVLTGSSDERLKSMAISQGADAVWEKGKDDKDAAHAKRRIKQAILKD